jgi:hypothetical protein
MTAYDSTPRAHARPDALRNFGRGNVRFGVKLDPRRRGDPPIHVRYASKSDQIDASQRTVAKCQNRTRAPQQRKS